MKAILIARVSTEEQKDAGNSLPAQMERLKQYCRNKGLEILQAYSIDESAYSNDRSEFDAIIDLILQQKKKIHVCCDKVDRLSRNVFDKRISLLYEKALNDEVELHFVSDGQTINSSISAVEKFQFGISLGLAKYYSDAISDNVKRAIEQKLRKGEWIAKVPYGYKYVGDGRAREVVVDEFESRIVKKAFELYATGTYSLALICNQMKEEHGLIWSSTYLDKMFNNHFYYGIMVVKGKQYPHRYETFISQSLFEKVQQLKRRANKKKINHLGKAFAYRGLMRCAHCNMSITPEQQKGYVYYHCTQYKGKHNAQLLREEVVTQALGEIFQKLQMPSELVAMIKTAIEATHQHQMAFHKEQTKILTREHKKITSMMDNLYLDKLQGCI